ncbi:hypothetical protein [Bacillus sp. UNC41MFS5]|uniref:hypothetical protein n=1 Tax=Bacillus sp. UNC41MFS5 TaxID=1449046 RepID=UPI00047E969A|nr:hypothetical protein [Bacillus sp. UNC41MFS5]
MPSPLKSNGFIDEEKLFKLVVGTLKICSFLDYESFLEDFIPSKEFEWMIEHHYEAQREHYDMLSNVVAFGYASAKKGKKIEMFEKKQETKFGFITPEQKKADFDYLDSIFNNNKEGGSE